MKAYAFIAAYINESIHIERARTKGTITLFCLLLLAARTKGGHYSLLYVVVAGPRFIGSLSYPVYGVVNNVLLTSWLWILTLAAMER